MFLTTNKTKELGFSTRKSFYSLKTYLKYNKSTSHQRPTQRNFSTETALPHCFLYLFVLRYTDFMLWYIFIFEIISESQYFCSYYLTFYVLHIHLPIPMKFASGISRKKRRKPIKFSITSKSSQNENVCWKEKKLGLYLLMVQFLFLIWEYDNQMMEKL